MYTTLRRVRLSTIEQDSTSQIPVSDYTQLSGQTSWTQQEQQECKSYSGYNAIHSSITITITIYVRRFIGLGEASDGNENGWKKRWRSDDHPHRREVMFFTEMQWRGWLNAPGRKTSSAYDVLLLPPDLPTHILLTTILSPCSTYHSPRPRKTTKSSSPYGTALVNTLLVSEPLNQWSQT